MPVISDSSTVTNLIQIGKLDLLEKLFGEVLIPQKVYEELSEYENQKEQLDSCDWILVKTVLDHKAAAELREVIDSGEAEVIVLAQELKADFLIIDERKGRKVAEERGLRIVGLLGILTRAKEAGHISNLKPLLDILVKEIGFRISPNLYDRILRSAGE